MSSKRFVQHDRGQSDWKILVLCLIAPAIFAFTRKITPGQPTFLEIGAWSVVFLVSIWISKRQMEFQLFVPFIYWGVFQCIYVTPSFVEDWRVGVVAFVSRIVPMLMLIIGFVSVHNSEDLRRASSIVGILPLLLLPAGIAASLLGNNAMPIWLRPIQALEDSGKYYRFGLSAVSTVFSSQATASLSFLVPLYLALASLSQNSYKRASQLFFWAVVATSLGLVFLSTRRGALICAVVGIIAYSIRSMPKARWNSLVLVAVLSLGIWWSNQYFEPSNEVEVTRTGYALDLDFRGRITEVFFPFTIFWIQNHPLGSYLGAGGPEANVLGIRLWEIYPIEVGAAQLAAELGILGTILMPITLLLTSSRILVKARNLLCFDAVLMLIIYQCGVLVLYYFKESSILSSVSMAQLFFWTVPGICNALIKNEQKSVINEIEMRKYACLNTSRRHQKLRTVRHSMVTPIVKTDSHRPVPAAH